MMNDEAARKTSEQHVVGCALDSLSVDELGARIVDLRVEIERISLEIEKKNASKSAADDVFKT